jgi:ABC-type sugar transport system substrate-binding protein
MKRQFPVSLAIVLLSTGMLITGCARKPGASATKKIAGIVFQEDQFFRLIIFGMRDAATKGGAELLEANSESKPDKEIHLINTYIASNVDAIVVSPLSAKASMSALQRAKEKGITIVTYNTTVEGDVPAAYIESDQVDLGRSTGKAAADYIVKHLGGRAKVALLEYLSQAPEQCRMRVAGFKEEMAKLPGVTIVAEQDAWLAEQAVNKVGDILTAHPDLNLIWGANEGGTVGSVMGVKNAGKAGKIVVFGTDTGGQICGFLLADDNILQAVTGQRPFEIGSLAVESALKALKGERVEPKVSLPGQLLTRAVPEEVRTFQARLKELSK